MYVRVIAATTLAIAVVYLLSEGMFLRKLVGVTPAAEKITSRNLVSKASLPSAMIKAASRIIPVPAKTLHVSKPTWWLESRFHFSFADHYDPSRMSFGHLRVLNDDFVKPRAGFGTHPHRDAEIFSYVVDGYLSHADNMGNKEALPRGCVQYLSAGTGITHSEMNDGDETCRFLQIWMTPDRRGHTPQYGSSTYSTEDRHNCLLHILGGTGNSPQWGKPGLPPSSIRLHQDANIFVSESESGKEFDLELGKSRMAYMVCIEGSMKVNDLDMGTRDGAKVMGSQEEPTDLKITTGPEGAHFMIIEMVKTE